jgi:hypothetical protein
VSTLTRCVVAAILATLPFAHGLASPVAVERSGDSLVTATGSAQPRSLEARFSDWTTPEDFGAFGDFNPATGTGHDDTAALQSAFMSGKAVRLAKGKVYLATAKLTVPNGTTIEGAGYRSSLIWGLLPNAQADLLQIGPSASGGRAVQLRNFGIVGGNAPGRAAITGWSISSSVIDVYINGGWEFMLRVWRDSEGISPPEGGGFEANRVVLEHTNADASLPFAPGLCPNPKRGIYIRGWINGSRIWANLGTTTVGDGIHVEGTYGSANNGTISGLFQGIAGWGVWVGGRGGMLTRIVDTHCELTGLGDIFVENISAPTIGPNVAGRITLSGTKDARISGHQGALHIGATAERTHIDGGGGADAPPIVNSSSTTTITGFLSYNTVGGLYYSGTPLAPTSDANLIVNGDLARFLGPRSGTAENIWGVLGHYVATRTGTGLPDNTHTNSSAYAAKITARPGIGGSAYFPIFDPGMLSTYDIGQLVTASFKWKSATPGIGHLAALHVRPTHVGEAYGVNVEDASVNVERGFRRYSTTFRITPELADEGVGLQLSFVDAGGAPAYYVSEVTAVLGGSTPRQFSPRTRDRAGTLEIKPGGLLHSWASAPPAVGGDPAFNRDWQVGDVVWSTTPTTTSVPAWVCTVAGSPGAWSPLSSRRR